MTDSPVARPSRLSPHLYSNREEERQRRQLRGLLFARVLLFSLLLGGLSLLPHKEALLPSWPLLVAFVGTISAISILSALWLRRVDIDLHRFSRWQLLQDLICCILLVAASGSSHSVFLPVMVFPISTGALVLRRHGSLKAAAVATLLLAACFTLEYSGSLASLPGKVSKLSPQPWHLLLNIFAVYGSIFFLVGLFGEILSSRLAKTERALHDRERDYAWLSRLYKQIFDDISVGIMTTDDQGKISSYNTAAEKITGFAAVRVIGRPLAESFPTLNTNHPDGDRHAVDFLRADGKLIRLSCAKTELSKPQLAQGVELESTPGGRVLTLEDVTQLELMEERIRKGQKMAAIGAMSAAIAHDMRNPLAAISGAAQLLNAEALTQHDASNECLLEIILRESSRLAAIITDFLQFARPAQAKMSWFEGRRLLEETWQGIQKRNGQASACHLDNQIPAGMDFWGDRQQIQTIFNHLLENSCYACRERDGLLQITAQEETDVTGASWLRLEVLDNGPGIVPEEIEKIFEPFYSTREDGTGMGLAIVRQLMTLHQGSVHAENRTVGGAAITLRLPLPGDESFPSSQPQTPAT